MKTKNMKTFFLAALAASATALSACSGGGGSASGADTAPKTLSAADCEAVAGPLDPVQAALAGNLLPGGTTFPIDSAVPGLLTAGLSRILDLPDALAGALQGLASSRDPQVLAAALATGGDALLCGVVDIEGALIELNRQAAAAATPIPGLPLALDQVRAVQEQLQAATLGNGSLPDLSGSLATLQIVLNQVSAQLPPGLNNAGTQFALDAIGVTTSHLALVLQELGQFDGNGVTAELGNTLTALATAISTSPAGLPSGLLTPITMALNTVATTVVPQLATVIVPVLDALEAVLTPQGNPGQIFQQILAGGLGGAPVGGGFGSLLGLLNGGGITSGGLPIPVLGGLLDTLLGGLLGGLLG